MRIEEAEAGEVSGEAELGGRGGEEEETGGFAGELFDELVVGAGVFWSPAEVVGFVHDDEIPAGLDGLGAAGGGVGSGEVGDAGEAELAGEERVFTGLGGFDGEAAGFVEDGEP